MIWFSSYRNPDFKGIKYTNTMNATIKADSRDRIIFLNNRGCIFDSWIPPSNRVLHMRITPPIIMTREIPFIFIDNLVVPKWYNASKECTSPKEMLPTPNAINPRSNPVFVFRKSGDVIRIMEQRPTIPARTIEIPNIIIEHDHGIKRSAEFFPMSSTYPARKRGAAIHKKAAVRLLLPKVPRNWLAYKTKAS